MVSRTSAGLRRANSRPRGSAPAGIVDHGLQQKRDARGFALVADALDQDALLVVRARVPVGDQESRILMPCAPRSRSRRTEYSGISASMRCGRGLSKPSAS